MTRTGPFALFPAPAPLVSGSVCPLNAMIGDRECGQRGECREREASERAREMRSVADHGTATEHTCDVEKRCEALLL